MVKLEGNMSDLKRSIVADNVTRIAGLAVLPVKRTQGAQINLKLPDGTNFAQVNAHHSKVFDSILQLPSTDLEAFVDLTHFKQTIESATRANEATMRISINVYGDEDHIDNMAKLLSDDKMFLQDPDHPRKGYKIYNPHLYVVSGNFSTQKETEMELDTSKTHTDKDEMQLGDAINDLYKSLKRGNNLKRVDGDSRLRIPLLPHQEQALDFMTQRETGPVPEEFRLWKERIEDGQRCYRHAITNALLSQRPAETGGGVLADTMGLGKTLSVLAMIAKTLGDAYEWQTANDASTSKHQLATKFSSRATLGPIFLTA
jgi:SWI/SNF-related matrix-associated actin-dependent regulator of chromatin subfamily A3